MKNQSECQGQYNKALKELGHKSIAPEVFNQTWRSAQGGIEIMKQNTLLFMEPDDNPVYPCLILNDTEDLEARQSNCHSSKIKNNFSARYRDVRKLNIANLARSLKIADDFPQRNDPNSKVGNRSIRVYFSEGSRMIKPLLEEFAREEGIIVRQSKTRARFTF